jgi:predicted nucleic acid-binding protein
LGIGISFFPRAHHRIAFDTNVFIYYLEDHPAHASMASEVFRWIETPATPAVTSTLTMTGLLVQLYRSANVTQAALWGCEHRMPSWPLRRSTEGQRRWPPTTRSSSAWMDSKHSCSTLTAEPR